MQIQAPDIGVDKALVAEILVKIGDRVAVEDSLLVLESDKATVEVPSTAAGIVKSILVKQGDEVTLSECRKLYRWDGACAVEQIAKDGILESKIKDCQFTVEVENATIMQVIQIIPCTEKAIKSIKSVPEWKR